jgi:hypothetical protein
MTAEFVNEHIDKPWQWGLNGLSSNPMTTHPETIRDKFHLLY